MDTQQLAKPLLSINFGLDNSQKVEIDSFFDEKEERVSGLMRDIVYNVNEFVFNELKSRISQDGDTKAYRESLTQKDIIGTDVGIEMNAIVSDDSEVSLAGLDGETTLISFVKRSGKGELSRFAKFLLNNEDWPLGMITSAPNTLKIVFSKATKLKVFKMRDEKMLLMKRVIDLSKSEKNLSDITKVIPNIGYIAVSSEFSINGVKGGAHWRPALLKLKGNIGKIVKDAVDFHLDVESENNEAKSFIENINRADMDEYEEFQKIIAG